MDETGRPVSPEHVPLTERGLEAGRGGARRVRRRRVRPRRLERPAAHRRDGGDRRARTRGRAAGRSSRSGAAAASTRSRPRSSSRSSSARSASPTRTPASSAASRSARRSTGPSGARPARGARMEHGPRRLPRRREPDHRLLRPLGRPDVLRHLRAGAGVHQRPRPRRRRLDRPHRQLRALRPAPPRHGRRRWSTSGRSSAGTSTARRARGAPRRPPAGGTRRGSRSTSASAPRPAPPRRRRRAGARVRSTRSSDRERVPEAGRHVELRLAEHRLRVDRHMAPPPASRMFWWWKSPCTSVVRPMSSDA